MSIDAFLQDLFPSAPAAPPASIADRFGGLDDGMMPQNATPQSGPAPSGMPIVNPPMPRPRPPIEGMLRGPTPRPAEAPQGPPMDIAPPAPSAPPPQDGSIMSRILGMTNPGMAADDREAGGPQPGDPRSVLGRITGLDQTGEKRLRTSLAGGFAGGNPNFKGGAFMQGASGALKGGLQSDEQDETKATAATQRKLQQANFDRQQSDKELTSDALRKLYADRGTALVTNADTRAQNPGGKPGVTQQIIAQLRAENPDLTFEAALNIAKRGSNDPKVRQAGERLALTAAKADPAYLMNPQKTLQKWRGEYGLDQAAAPPGGPPAAAPATPGSPRSQNEPPAGVEYDNSAISGAREAIARGANAEQVKKRLKDNGIKFSDEDLAL